MSFKSFCIQNKNVENIFDFELVINNYRCYNNVFERNKWKYANHEMTAYTQRSILLIILNEVCD